MRGRWSRHRASALAAAPRHLLLAGAGVAAGALLLPSVVSSRADEVTISAATMRDGWDPGETGASLTPATLKNGTFGAVFPAEIDGQAYAQPIIAGDTWIVGHRERLGVRPQQVDRRGAVEHLAGHAVAGRGRPLHRPAAERRRHRYAALRSQPRRGLPGSTRIGLN